MLENIGLGAKIYKGISGIGAKQLRTLTEGTNVELIEGETDITVNVPNSSETVVGAAALASQAEVNAGTEATKIVTPATLAAFSIAVAPDGSETIVTSGANTTITGTGTSADPYVVSTDAAAVPDGSETIITEGTAITITGTGTSGDPYVITADLITPEGSETIVTPGTNVTITGAGTSGDPYVINAAAEIPLASETVAGAVEEATQTEVNAGTDTGASGAQLFVSPSKLQSHMASTLPSSYMRVVTVPDITSWGYNSINYLTHNIGINPMDAVIHAICTSAQGDYSPGDIILITNHGEFYENEGSGSQAGVTFHLNTSSIASTLLISKRIVAVQKATTSSTFVLDVTKWDLRVKFIYVN